MNLKEEFNFNVNDRWDMHYIKDGTGSSAVSIYSNAFKYYIYNNSATGQDIKEAAKSHGQQTRSILAIRFHYQILFPTLPYRKCIVEFFYKFTLLIEMCNALVVMYVISHNAIKEWFLGSLMLLLNWSEIQ